MSNVQTSENGHAWCVDDTGAIEIIHINEEGCVYLTPGDLLAMQDAIKAVSAGEIAVDTCPACFQVYHAAEGACPYCDGSPY